MALRWGIACAGNISHDFATAIGTLPSNEHKILAVAARNIDRAKEFAELHQIPKSYESYEELAKDPDVEIVYIGAVHQYHLELSMLMLNNGKHVLCEVPLGINEKQVKQIVTLAEEKQLFLMEGTSSRFFPAYQYLRQQIDNGSLGQIQHVKVSFGFDLRNFERLMKKSFRGGSLLEFGPFVIQLSQWIFQETPTSIKASGELNEEGCDLTADVELTYPNGGKSSISASIISSLDNNAVVIGTKGQITIKNFWVPETIIDVDGQERTWKIPEGKHKTIYPNNTGLRYEAEEARKSIREGKVQSGLIKHKDSLEMVRIEDEIRKQIGVRYEEDE